MESADPFVALLSTSVEYLDAHQEALYEQFQLGTWPRWDWHQDSGELVFSADGIPRVVANIQFVGSVSNVTGTWLWAWANPHLDERWTREMLEVRQFGAAREFWKLTTRKWEADEGDGWEMTSIAAYVLQAQGAYRTPGEKGLTYMLLRNVRWAGEMESVRPAV